jgi:hypothetical protein
MSNETTTKKLEMKPLEVGVGAGAAVITAFASSYLGTAGTLSGAALASVVGTVSTSVLRSSATASTERLRETTARLRETRTGTMPRPTDVRPVESGSDEIDPYGTQLFGVPDPEKAAAEEAAARPGRRNLVLLGVGTVVAFAVALVLITGIESAAGKPLSALVGNSSGGGTTLGRATGTDGGSGTTPTPAPTSTATPTGTSTGESTATEDPSASPTTEPGATEPTPAPSATTPAPTGSAPAPTAPPSATTNPLTSESPQAATPGR